MYRCCTDTVTVSISALIVIQLKYHVFMLFGVFFCVFCNKGLVQL